MELRFLGEIVVSREGERLPLPHSKKTRALLAYLVVSGRPHRRDRLCSMFWDVTDDPRGALRWSLSKLRTLVDETDNPRIVADRDKVAFHAAGATIDILTVRKQLARGVDEARSEQLMRLANEYRGEFLEGLELPDFHGFQAWCIAEREQARTFHTKILGTLINRLEPKPEQALRYARTLVQVDPLDEASHSILIRLLAETGRHREAEQQVEAAHRLLKELGQEATGELRKVWGEVRKSKRSINSEPDSVASIEPAAKEPGDIATPSHAASLVGRRAERSRLLTALKEVASKGRERVLLLKGEPGVGKTRLLSELIAEAHQLKATVLDSRAYEAECGRPYGPWIDALRRLPPVTVDNTLGTDLAPLLPEVAPETETLNERSRDRMFGAVVELIAARACRASPVLIAFDDVEWFDDASASLLHYVARMNRHQPVLIALAARDGELPDNIPMLRLLRGLQRSDLLEEVELGPLSDEETGELIRDIAPQETVERVITESAGNPLFALELARSMTLRSDEIPTNLNEIVREQMDRLSTEAADVLRWGAVLGRTFNARRLEELSAIRPDGLISSLETLERHGLLHVVSSTNQTQGSYVFAHELVRRLVYSEISEPRRRLMHWRVAKVLGELEEEGANGTTSGDIAHHASLAGENAVAARACVKAGRHCLGLFANTEAYSLARRGLHYAEELNQPEKVKLMLELLEVRLWARRPVHLHEEAKTIEALAEQALDYECAEHARLGFHMLSYLRWEGGDWSDAKRQTLRAELVSRSANGKERVVAMAEAARCLAILERDLGQAEAMVLEAGALSARLGIEPTAVPDAVGMLRWHQGNLEEAIEQFQEARLLSRRQHDRLGEFQALEHRIMLEIERQHYAEARTLCEELVKIGDKLREGSEAPFARTLKFLAFYATGEEDANAPLEEALQELREVDAKHRLAFTLTRAAALDLSRGRLERARQRAREALDVAGLLERPSEVALARVVLAKAAERSGDEESLRHHLGQLGLESLRGVAHHVRLAVENLHAEKQGSDFAK